MVGLDLSGPLFLFKQFWNFSKQDLQQDDQPSSMLSPEIQVKAIKLLVT